MSNSFTERQKEAARENIELMARGIVWRFSWQPSSDRYLRQWRHPSGALVVEYGVGCYLAAKPNGVPFTNGDGAPLGWPSLEAAITCVETAMGLDDMLQRDIKVHAVLLELRRLRTEREAVRA